MDPQAQRKSHPSMISASEKPDVDDKIRPAEARLYQVAKNLPGESVVVVSVGRAQAACLVARDRPQSKIWAWYLDQFRMSLAQQHRDASSTEQANLSNVNFACTADWPDLAAEPDLVLIEQPKSGEAELGRDLFQIAWEQLKTGGILAVATDNPKDRWLLQQLQTIDRSLKTRPFKDAVVYYLVKQKPLRRRRDFTCQLTFRDEGNLIQLVTRPGVFAHRKLDPGARQIMDVVEVFPEASLIEIGCGSGAVSLALAKRDATANVLAIDSNARAIDCLRQGIQLNGLSNLSVMLNHDGILGDQYAGRFDMALANPPYYADFQIAQHFIGTALSALRTGGRLMLVTRKPQWYRDHLPQWLDECEIFESRRYHLCTGLKPEGDD